MLGSPRRPFSPTNKGNTGLESGIHCRITPTSMNLASGYRGVRFMGRVVRSPAEFLVTGIALYVNMVGFLHWLSFRTNPCILP